MKPRRLVRATTFSINCSRATVRSGLCLQDGEDVAGRVFEPRDVRAPVVRKAPSDAFLVRYPAVVLERDAFGDQLVHGLIDVLDRKVEHRVRRGLVILLGIDQDAVSDLQPDAGRALLDRESQRLSVELPGHVEVVDGKAAERSVNFQHVRIPSSGSGTVATSGAGPGDAPAAWSAHLRSSP